jgi:hypothetical protein
MATISLFRRELGSQAHRTKRMRLAAAAMKPARPVIDAKGMPSSANSRGFLRHGNSTRNASNQQPVAIKDQSHHGSCCMPKIVAHEYRLWIPPIAHDPQLCHHSDGVLKESDQLSS